MQEPVANNKNKKVKGPNGGFTYHTSKQLNGALIRSAIWVRNSILKNPKTDCFLLEQLSDRDHSTIRTKVTMSDGDIIDLVICSIYCPSTNNHGHKIENPISPIINKIIHFCKEHKLELILAGDVNAHCETWGDSKNDIRGKHFLDFLIKSNNLSCQNKGSIATFAVGNKQR